MTTVFGTSARNWANGHGDRLASALRDPANHLAPATQGAIMQALKKAGSNGLQSSDIARIRQAHPDSARFFQTYKDWSHDLLAHASGQGFLMGAVFGGVALLAAIFLVNVKKSDIPSDPAAAAAVH